MKPQSIGAWQPIDAYRGALEHAVGVPFVDGNRVSVLQNGDEIFPSMLEAIESAGETVEFATFVYWTGSIADRFAESLAAAAQRGIEVRVLLDAVGAKPMRSELVDTMSDAGVEIRWFRPLATFRLPRVDKRTHRKILITDGTVGFTGGVGIADEWTGDARNPSEWRDTHVRIEGPAVTGLYAAFMDNWNEAGEWKLDPPRPAPTHIEDGIPVQVVRASSTIGWTDIATLLRSLVAIAQQRIRIVTAYFNPDPPLVELLLATLRRDVSVEIMVPGPYCDSPLSQLAGHRAIEQLLKEGAQVWRYTKTMLHAKVIVVDDWVCCVGSPNMNYRSVCKDEECCIVAVSSELARRLEDDFDSDLEASESLNYDSWRNRGAWIRFRERIARIIIDEL